MLFVLFLNRNYRPTAETDLFNVCFASTPNTRPNSRSKKFNSKFHLILNFLLPCLSGQGNMKIMFHHQEFSPLDSFQSFLGWRAPVMTTFSIIQFEYWYPVVLIQILFEAQSYHGRYFVQHHILHDFLFPN